MSLIYYMRSFSHKLERLIGFWQKLGKMQFSLLALLSLSFLRRTAKGIFVPRSMGLSIGHGKLRS